MIPISQDADSKSIRFPKCVHRKGIISKWSEHIGFSHGQGLRLKAKYMFSFACFAFLSITSEILM